MSDEPAHANGHYSLNGFVDSPAILTGPLLLIGRLDSVRKSHLSVSMLGAG